MPGRGGASVAARGGRGQASAEKGAGLVAVSYRTQSSSQPHSHAHTYTNTYTHCSQSTPVPPVGIAGRYLCSNSASPLAAHWRSRRRARRPGPRGAAALGRLPAAGARSPLRPPGAPQATSQRGGARPARGKRRDLGPAVPTPGVGQTEPTMAPRSLADGHAREKGGMAPA